ncbi:HAD family hydrolase [Halobacillus litoralis]|uniref:HAD family hydrolase n=1 Tax=Halobacillus litoralis TaxID=45668 RepID=UPI00136B71B2|nr:HAD family hydrolase [Halobacillus litoralis]
MIENAECLIFDLDGTLYEDVDHFQYYADLLKERVSQKNQQSFDEDYKAILNGEHLLMIGKVYDMERDTIVTVDPFTGRVEKVTSWYGDLWDREAVRKAYPQSLQYDFEHYIAIGDGWWLPFAVAMHYGVGIGEARECYVKTKDFMATEEFLMSKTKGLKAALERWKEDKLLVLLTNSEDYDVENMLNRIDLSGLFHDHIPSAFKPQKTEEHFQTILDRYNLNPEEVVSIGDNFLNEIAPALNMGMKAVFVQLADVEFDYPNLQVVKSLEDICP